MSEFANGLLGVLGPRSTCDVWLNKNKIIVKISVILDVNQKINENYRDFTGFCTQLLLSQ